MDNNTKIIDKSTIIISQFSVNFSVNKNKIREKSVKNSCAKILRFEQQNQQINQGWIQNIEFNNFYINTSGKNGKKGFMNLKEINTKKVKKKTKKQLAHKTRNNLKEYTNNRTQKKKYTINVEYMNSHIIY